MALTKTALQSFASVPAHELPGLKELTEKMRARVQYRSDLDTVPIADTVVGSPLGATAPPATAAPLEQKSSELNILVGDYWSVTAILIR